MIWLFHLVSITILLILSKIKRDDRIFIVSSFFYSLFIFGQRWMTGTDFPNYLRYYLSDFKVSEPGYYFLQKFLASNNLYFGLLIFLVFFITIYNNYRFIIKIDRHVVLIIFLYLISEIFFAQLSQIRQFVAVSFFINSYYYVFHDKYVKAIVNIILGLLFHTSILFIIPFMFLRIKLDKIRATYLIILSSILPLLNLSIFLRLPFFSRYSHYLDSVFNTDLSIFHYFKFYVLLIFILWYLWNTNNINSSKMHQMILNGLVINMLIYGMSFEFALLLRVSFYFKIFEIVFLIYFYKDIYIFSEWITKLTVIGLFLGIYLGVAAVDSYQISRYQFVPLSIHETRSVNELYSEIYQFHE